MGLKDIINSARNILSVTVKPTWDEFSLLFKIVLVGLVIVGLYSFAVQLTALAFVNFRLYSSPYVIWGLTGFIVIVYFIVYYRGRKSGWW
ncbi:MAG: preprotein translocase subunit SecE [Thermoprotei archaeon]